MTFRTIGGKTLDAPVQVFGADGQPRALQEVTKRTNILPNPTFRSSSGVDEVRRNLGWSGSNLSWGGVAPTGATWTTTQPVLMASGGPENNGTFLRLTVATGPSASPSGGFGFGTSGSTVIPVTPAQPYSVRIKARTSRPGISAYLYIRFYDGAGGQVGGTVANSASPSTPIPTDGSWVQISVSNVVAPTGSVRAFVTLYANGGTGLWQVGDTFDAGGLLIENASGVLSWFDGNTAATPEGWTYGWLGTPGASASRLTAPLVTGNMSAYAASGYGGGKTTADPEVLRLFAKQTAGSLWAFQRTADAPVAPGEYVAARLQVRQVGGTDSINLQPRIGHYSASNTYQAALSSPPQVALPPNSGWIDLDFPSLTAGVATGETARMMLYKGSGNVPLGTTIEIRRVIMEKVSGPGLTVGEYFDGSTPVKTRRNLFETVVTNGSVTKTDNYVWNNKTWTRTVVNTSGHGLRSRVSLKNLSDGKTYTTSVEVANPTTSTLTFSVDWCDGAITSVVLQPGETRQVSVTGSRATYDNVYRFADFALTTPGEFLIREVLIEEGNTAFSYFNGSTTPANGYIYGWDGTAGASASYQTHVDYTYGWTGTADNSASEARP